MKSLGLKSALILVVMALCIVFPIWQSSKTAKLQERIAVLENKISDLKEEEIEINSQIAQQTSPEYVMETAVQNGLEFNQIGSMASSSIAINF